MKENKDYKWLSFYNKFTGKQLYSITIEGLFYGEINATKKLLAYENNINQSDIEIIFE